MGVQQSINIDSSGDVILDAASATSALQVTGNASLASIDAGIPAALGATSSANSMPVIDIIGTAAQQQSQSITTTAALALGGGSALANRKLIIITPTNGTIYWGVTSGVTTATGQPLTSGSSVALSFAIPVYVIAASTVTAIITEAS